MSVGEKCDEGNRVVFGASGGFVYNLMTGSVTHFTRNNKLYELEHWVKTDMGKNRGLDFARQGM